MNQRDQVLHFLALAKARVEGEDVVQTLEARKAVGYARDRLEEAMDHAHAGEALAADVRLRPVKQAIVAAVRPVTSHQRHFNLQLLAATDALTACIEGLAQADDGHESRANRVQAALATTDLTVDHLVEGVRRLSDAVTSIAADIGDVRATAAEAAGRQADELATIRAGLDAVRSELAALRAEQHLVARVAPPAS